MRELGFYRIFEEILFPFVLYALFSWFMLSEAVNAIREVKRFKREGCKVTAKIKDYNSVKCDNGQFCYYSYNVMVECRSPKSDIERNYYLSTTDNRAKRYKKLKETEVYFLSKDDGNPVLKEELHITKRVRFTAMFGGIFCVLFCTLIFIAFIHDLING